MNGKVRINDGTQGVDRVLVSDVNGSGSWKSMAVGFRVHGTVLNGQTYTATASKADWNIVSFNDGGNYNTGTDEYIVPESGVYSFQAACAIDGQTNGSWVIMELRVNGITQFQSFSNPNSWSSAGSYVGGAVKANTGDRVSVYIRNSNGGAAFGNVSTYNYFSGFRLY